MQNIVNISVFISLCHNKKPLISGFLSIIFSSNFEKCLCMCAYGAKNPASPRAVLPNKRIRREANGALRAKCGHLEAQNADVREA